MKWITKEEEGRGEEKRSNLLLLGKIQDHGLQFLDGL